jgi:hypothetical protein
VLFRSTRYTACRLDNVKLARKYLRELSTGLRTTVENPRIYVRLITKKDFRHARECPQNVRPPCYTSDIQTKRKVVKMTTLTITKCAEHAPHKPSISEVQDTQFTFCETCENNIERWYDDTDPERLPMWTDWKVSK